MTQKPLFGLCHFVENLDIQASVSRDDFLVLVSLRFIMMIENGKSYAGIRDKRNARKDIKRFARIQRLRNILFDQNTVAGIPPDYLRPISHGTRDIGLSAPQVHVEVVRSIFETNVVGCERLRCQIMPLDSRSKTHITAGFTTRTGQRALGLGKSMRKVNR